MGDSFIAQLNKGFFVLVISCESFNPFPFTSKDMNNIFIHELISLSAMRINYLLIKLDNTFKKEKKLNKGFSLFNFSLILKGLLSFLLSN
jgi:hypothetical protein